MSLFSKPEVVILKESSDAKNYLNQLEELKKQIPESSSHYKELDKEIMMIKAGIAGEDAIMFELKNSGLDLVVLHDILLEDPAGNKAQIDFYIITPCLNIIIECKNLYGNIEINEKGDFVRTVYYGGKFNKEGIYSPVTQNERHIQVIKECKWAESNFVYKLSLKRYFADYHKSLVVLANPKTVVNDKKAPQNVKAVVIRADQLISKIKELNAASGSGAFKLSAKEMREAGEIMLARNVEERKDYIEKYAKWKNDIESETVVETAAESPESRICPRCGNPLVLRTAKKGENVGNTFWGCSAFPKCRYHEY